MLVDVYKMANSQSDKRAALVKYGNVFFLVLNQTDFDESLLEKVSEYLD
jgi:hypothetical protein